MRERMQRLDLYMKNKGLNDNIVTVKCGLSQGLLSQARTGKSDIGQKTIEKILSIYQDLNRVWLLTGEGDMLVENENVLELPSDAIQEGMYTGALVYDIDGTCGFMSRDLCFAEDNVIGSVDLPEINKSSKIIRASGDSMEPKIHDGDFIVIREIMSRCDIFYGQIYLILTEEYRMIKYIRRFESDEENFIILRSSNKNYDDIKLHKSKIRKLFIVENILSIKTQL